ncbi:MAG: transcription-repair coupling factor, partial [Gammaproteobacteria bacterium]|nr:transcription-repair coupling factor [Gammaproteobacteria bacterium]
MSHASCFTYPRLQPHQRWGQLHGSALPLMISEFVQSVEPMCLVMAPNSLAASRIHQALGVFLEASADIELLFFPDWETLPYDRFSPYQDLVSQRLLTLNRMTQAKRLVIVSSISTLMQRVPPAAFLLERVWLLKVGQHMHLHRLRESLESVGYRSTTQVLEHGEYSIRGSLIDVFPMGNALPFRIELFDDEVESLRTFDPETQRTIEKMPSLHFFPAREFPTDEAAIALFRKKYREVFPGNASQSLIYEAVTAGQFPSGIEYYLPLFYEKTATLLDYLPASAPVFFIEDVRAEADKFWKEVQSRYEEYRHDVSRPILSPEMLFIDPLSFFKQTRDFSTIQVSIEEDKKGYCFQAQPAPSLPVQRKSAAPLETLLAYLEEKSTLTSSRAQRGISPSEASSEFKEIP